MKSSFLNGGSYVPRALLFTCLASPLATAVGSTGELPSEDIAHGIELGIAYTGDVWRNASGGIERGAAYLDNLDVTLDLDGEALWGVPGLHLFAYGLYNNGRTFSDRYVGDAMVVSNIDTDRAVRLYELWAEWRPGGTSGVSMRAGLYDLNSEFDATPTRGLFIQSTHGIGQDIAQTGENGPSIFPVTSLAVRAAWAPAADWLVKLAVLDGVPGDPEQPDRTAIRLGSEEGALIIGELSYARGRVTQAYAAIWGYTARFEELDAPPADGSTATTRRNLGAYAGIDWALSGDGVEAGGVSAFLRAGTANGRVNAFDRYVGAGVAGPGWLEGDDRIGLAIAASRASDAFRRTAVTAGVASDRTEVNVELTWRIPVNEWLTLQPDLQYVVNPGVDASLDNAFVVGIRFEVGRAWSFVPRGR